MTGFGDASRQVDQVHYAIEVRSVNNRFFKATVRLPDAIAGLEAELETQLRKRLSRGSVTLVVKMRDPTADAPKGINQQVLDGYLASLKQVHAQVASSDQATNIDLTALLALPGVLQLDDLEETAISRARPTVMELTDQACDRLLAMRLTEGKAIAEDLAGQRQVIRTLIESVAEWVPQVVEEYHTRLRGRIDDLIARAALKVEERELIHEVAVFAERSDISEEVTRMHGHLDQFEKIIGSSDDEPAGRTLDFLTQELLREANTIASKSNDAGISRAIVEAKGAIDRIKEQVQNVE